ADIVESEKAALEDVHAFRVLAIYPPGEIQQELLKHAFEKGAVSASSLFLFDLVDAPSGPGVHRGIDVAERPFVSGQLSVRMHVPFAQEEHELLLGKVGIDEREGYAMER